MAEFSYIEDWSLQAIVRGSSGDFEKIVDLDMDGQDSFFGFSGNHQPLDREFLASFPEIFEGSNDELEDLYKPFYPLVHSLPVQNNVLEFQELRKPENMVEDPKQTHEPSDHSSRPSSVARVNPAYTPKYKRRKNQHKRVVIQVSAEGLGSDMWAWRKYGQKPIKGSPYPRSYYRCSSSKGCLARKQVEQSCTDPGMFIITYTAEHSHSQPTRRNSLAGTVRQKFPSAPKSPNPGPNKNHTSNSHVKRERSEGNSPKTLLQEMELPIKAGSVKQEIKEELDQARLNGMAMENLDEDMNDFGMNSDMVFGDDFFSGLEEFDDFISELPMSHDSQQFPVIRSCS